MRKIVKGKGSEVKAASAAEAMTRSSSSASRITTAADKAALAFTKGSKHWGTASAVLENVRAVPTIFPQVDFATRVGGWPVDRVTVVHGPSNNGKSEFALGLGISFLRRGHFFDFVDAERTTPKAWAEALMGHELVSSPRFMVNYPDTYEKTRDAVREKAEWLADIRSRRGVDENTTLLFVIDSLKKLTPKRLWDEMQKAALSDEEEAKRKKYGGGSKGIDGYGGRAGQFKAALNAAWFDELVPLMHQTRCGILIIARETELEFDLKAKDKAKVDQDVKVGGGVAVNYEASLRGRIVREREIYDDPQARNLVGERTRVELRKTKVGPKEEQYPTAWFHTSTGVDGSPFGFDLPRDLLEMATDRNVIEKRGSHYFFEDDNIGNGADHALASLRKNLGLLDAVERAVRDGMKSALVGVEVA